MSRTSVWMIRLSLVYFLAAAGIGALLLLNKAYPVYPAIWLLLPVHIELMIFGWVIQLTLGVAYWILPRYLEGEARGNKKLAWLMALFINAGIWSVILSGLNILPHEGLLAGRIMETGAVILFIILHWNRIITYRHSHSH